MWQTSSVAPQEHRGSVLVREVVVAQRGMEAEAEEYLSRLSPEEGLVLDLGGALSPGVSGRYRRITPGGYLSTEEALSIDRVACDLALSWHGGDAGPKFNGIPVGDMIAYEAMQWFISAMKFAAVLSRLCSEEKPETLVVPEDPGFLDRILCVCAEIEGLPVRRLALLPGKGSSPTGGKAGYRRDLAASAGRAFEILHSGRNACRRLGQAVAPGFLRAKGLRCVLFDPYVGYERLLPMLFGNACDRVVVPCPNVRGMPRIRYFEEVFGVQTRFFHASEGAVLSGSTDDIVDRLRKTAVGLGDRPAPLDLPGLRMDWKRLFAAFGEHSALLIRKACAEIEMAERILRKHGVDTTVLPYDEFGLYKALVLVGKRRGLLTVRFQHGVANRYAAFIPPTSEKVIVWEEKARELFQSFGVEESRLALLENPMVPVLGEKISKTDTARIRRSLGILPGRKVVLYAAMPFCGLSALDHPEEVNESLEGMFRVAHGIPEIDFLIKLHPNDGFTGEFRRVREQVTRHGLRNVKVLVSGDAHELILASDVTVAETSTCLWEATVFRKPSIAFVNRGFVRRIYPYDGNPGILRADGHAALEQALRKVLAQGSAENVEPRGGTVRADKTGGDCPSYYDDPRWELLSLVPSHTRKLLDVGCGSGWLGRKVKATRPCHVVGIESHRDAAEAARKVLDEVYCADVETFRPPFPGKVFDGIVFGDILEHLRDPWEVLKKFTGYLRDGGVFILSIPNVRHYTTFLSLAKGRWEYMEEGLLDRTHLRFFTRSGIEDLLAQSGLRPVRVLRNTGSGRIMRAANLLSRNRLEDLITFQYLVVAERSATGSGH